MAKGFSTAQGTVLLLEATAFAMLIVLLAKPLVGVFAAALAIAALLVAFLFALFVLGKKAFGKDFKAHAIFFVFLAAVILAFGIWQSLLGENIDAGIGFFVAIVCVMAAFAVFFKARFGKRFCAGTVVAIEAGKAVVETDFDFLALAGKTRFKLAARKGLKKGQRLKLRVRKTLLATRAEIAD